MDTHAAKSWHVCETCFFKQITNFELGSSHRWTVLRDKLIQQNYRCAYSGDTLVPGMNAAVDHKLPYCRFPEHRYDPDNVEWVTLEVNELKRDRTPDEFLDLLRRIAQCRLVH